MSILGEVQQSLRQLRRHSFHSLGVVATLALGIAGATAIFSFVDGVLLNPLDYPEAGELVVVCETHPEHDDGWCGASPANLMDWSRETRTLRSLGLARSWSFGLKDGTGRFTSISGGVATAGLFQTLGATAAMGRLLEAQDHHPGQDHVVILSDGLWRRRFAGDATIVGSTINLDEETYQVVGVLPPAFQVAYLEEVELWIPLWADRVSWRGWRGLRPYGRLAPGRDLEEARAELSTLAAGMARAYPETNEGWSVRVDRLQDRMVAGVRPALLIFLGAVGLVLLIACANAASLLLARASSREREIAIRTALGAGPARILRLLLIDSLVLALLGGAVGVLVASWLVGLFVGLAPPGFPRLEEVGIDADVLMFAVLVSCLASLLAGLFPAWQSARVDPHVALKEGRRPGSGPGAGRARDLLVVAEITLTVILLVASGLLIRSFVQLTDWNPGFDKDHVLAFSVFPPLGKYPEAEQLRELYRRTRERIRGLPGVESVGEVSAGPLFGGGDGRAEFLIEGRPPSDDRPTVEWFDCGPDYFRTLGIPLRQGRYFAGTDGAEAPPVAIVNETFARRYLAGEEILGRSVRIPMLDQTFEIVGVVADVQPFDPREPIPPRIFWPLDQALRGATFYAVRTSTEPASLTGPIRSALQEIEPEMGVGSVLTLRDRMTRELIRPRFHMLLVGIFSILAFTISMVGIYGVVAYAVARRTQELGVRIVLGASRGSVLAMILRRGVLLAGAGVLLGSLGALGAVRLIESLLVEVAPTDGLTFASVAVSVLAVALLACAIPALQATRIDPARALREE